MKRKSSKVIAYGLSLAILSGLIIQTDVQAKEFSDVSASDWYSTFVTEMAEQGFINGTSDTTYNPEKNLSVAEFTKMITAAFYGNDVNENVTGEWWTKFFNAANINNALVGTNAENSSDWATVAGENITRFEMSVIIYNLLVNNNVELLSTDEVNSIISELSDDIDPKYATAVANAYNCGFLSGYEDKSFRGNNSLTRGEASKVLHTLVNSSLITVNKYVDPSVTTTSTVTKATTTFANPVTTTGQTKAYDNDGNVITPTVGSTYYGQDSHYASSELSYVLNADGTTYDNVTGLTWETIPLGGKMTWEEAIEYCENLTLGGYSDWRMPTVEELFSISDFSQGWPFLDAEYFSFDESGEDINSMGGSPQGGSPQGGSPQGSGSESQPAMGTMPPMENGEMPPMGEGTMPPMENGEMPSMGEGMAPPMSDGTMPARDQGGEAPSGENTPPPSGDSSGGASKDDGQYWTASENMVEGDSRLGNIAFGVNHTTGHIKAYPADSSPIMGKYVRAVRGDVYGAEDYTNNGDGTITDNASGLMWLEVDLGVAVEWAEALSLAETSAFAGYTDWRLPDVKELQSIVDYSGSYPAINQNYFTCTELEENENYYYWTSTSAYFSEMAPDYDSAWYVAFGYTSHGAGAVRFSPKYVGSDAMSEGEDNILNSVRLVRNID